MKVLSSTFFITAPLALFCSDNGTGIILCPVFIILGFVFRWIDEAMHPVTKIDPSKFWEWHYNDRMRKTLSQKDTVGDRFIAARDQEARQWATTLCRCNSVWIPPESTQEEIARATGIITEKIIKGKDKIQFGKYYAMDKAIQCLEKENKANRSNSQKWFEVLRYIDTLKQLRDKITYVGFGDVCYTTMIGLKRKFGVDNESEVWEKVLCRTERQQAEDWVRAYFVKFEKEEEDKKNGIVVKRDNEYLEKHGFRM